MPITNFQNGISSFGVPIAGPSVDSMFDNYWFVDNSTSSVINTGKLPDKPCKTIAAAVALASAGDTIYVRGTGTDYDEAVTVAVDNLSLIGIGTHVKQCGWNSDSDTTCLTITGNGCVVDGFYFRPEGATSGIAIDIGSATSTSTGLYTTIKNNLFKSSTTTCKYGISASGVPGYVKVLNNHFTWVGTAIASPTVLKPGDDWEIIGNYFSDKCTNGIVFAGRKCLINENYFNVHTVSLNLTGGSYNCVGRNHFGGDYSTATSMPGTNDVWTGNWANDVGEAEVAATSGSTSIVPAA
jgi:hypothetical protein